MDAKLKAKWLRALRGKKYRQQKGGLMHRGSFCCLGVLADIQCAQWIDGVPIIKGDDDPQQGRCTLLPRFAGGLRKATQETLIRMNDGENNFKEIADYIEQNL